MTSAADVTSSPADGASREVRLRRFGAFLDEGLLGIAEADPDGRLRYVNDRCCDMIGRVREELIGRSLFDAGQAGVWPDLKAFPRHEREEAGPWIQDLRISRNPGKPADIRVIGGWSREADGEPAGLLLVLMEMNEVGDQSGVTPGNAPSRREFEARLEQSVQERTAGLQAVCVANSQFLGQISHELRNPMNAILGFAQIMDHHPLTPEQRDMLGMIRESGSQLLEIINAITDYLRIEIGGARPGKEVFDLNRLLNRVERQLSWPLGARGIRLRISPLPAGVGALLGYPNRLEQILVNLLANAIDSTESEGVELIVSLPPATTKTPRLRFELRNSGIGAGILAQEADSPHPVDTPHAERLVDNVLGLTVIRHLVEVMGGEFGVSPARDEEPVIWLDLPLETASAEPPSSTGQSPRKGPCCAPRLKGMRVLIVDDNPINQRMIERVLMFRGAKATLAGNGLKAVEILGARPDDFDAVFMDVQMPVMDGLTATRAIRRIPGLSRLPIIALTAGVLEDERSAAMRAGVSDFLTKPLDLEEMDEVLGRHLNKDESIA